MSEKTDYKNSDNFDFKKAYGDKLMEHDYDGIKELNNPAPRWLMAILYLSIIFSIVYGVYYFILGGPTQIEEYNIASLKHDKKYEKENAKTISLELLKDESSIQEGSDLFVAMNCAVCHGQNGEGNAIGPNLTDDSWINGCDITSVFNIIKNGNPSKGMTPFKSQMSDPDIRKVASFVLGKLRGSNPENQKEAQGTECK